MKTPNTIGTAHAAIVAAAVSLACAGASQASPSVSTKMLASAQHFAADKPSALQPLFQALYIEGEHNAVLNFNYLGLAALESGEYETAEKAFDAAIARIEAIYADNPSAAKAKSVFAEEKVKDFKGEPYERAMTYYYRGLLFVRAGDYQNARASFLAAERQSTLSEVEAYKSTFGLMDYLAGWSSQEPAKGPCRSQDILVQNSWPECCSHGAVRRITLSNHPKMRLKPISRS